MSLVFYMAGLMFVLMYELSRQIKRPRFDFVSLINFNFAVVYFLTGSLLVGDESFAGKEAQLAMYSNYEIGTFLGVLSIYVAYLSSIVGYVLTEKKWGGVTRSIVPRAEKSYLWSAYISVIISVVAFAAYTSQYGGALKAISYSAAIRSGDGDYYLEGEGSVLFFKYLMPVLLLSILVFMGKWLTDRKLFHGFMFLLCLLMIVPLYLSMAGRGRFVFLFLHLLLLYSVIRGLKVGGFTVIASVLIVLPGISFIILYGKTFFSSLKSLASGEAIQTISYDRSEPIYDILRNFEHRVVSTDVAVQSFGQQDMTLFYDLFMSPFFLIPSRLFGIEKPDSIAYLNTYNIMGLYESTIPPGLVGYGLYSLSFIGVVIVAFSYGMLGSFADSVRSQTSGFQSKVIYVGLTFLLLFQAFTGEPRVFILSAAPLMLFWSLTLIIDRFLRRRAI